MDFLFLQEQGERGEACSTIKFSSIRLPFLPPTHQHAQKKKKQHLWLRGGGGREDDAHYRQTRCIQNNGDRHQTNRKKTLHAPFPPRISFLVSFCCCCCSLQAYFSLSGSALHHPFTFGKWYGGSIVLSSTTSSARGGGGRVHHYHRHPHGGPLSCV